MKEYFAAHRVFAIVTGSMILVALVLLFGVAIPARGAASDALAGADRLRAAVKSSEGGALSAGARRQLEGEVEALRARVAELERLYNPPAAAAGSDPVVVYGEQLNALTNMLSKVASEKNVVVPERPGFPASPGSEDVPGLLPALELARRIVPRIVDAGVQRIELIQSPVEAGDFFSPDMADAGPVRRTVVVVEVAGPTDALARLLHSLQQKDSPYAVVRARLVREKSDSSEVVLRIALGGVQVSDVKPKEDDRESGFIFGR
ncbi:MAG: hypothetical protein HUU15_13155 [Candidatus Brocadiae bacterium]|nr:hypothetical protein [Candidatus Brocadiia bacterium]